MPGLVPARVHLHGVASDLAHQPQRTVAIQLCARDLADHFIEFPPATGLRNGHPPQLIGNDSSLTNLRSRQDRRRLIAVRGINRGISAARNFASSVLTYLTAETLPSVRSSDRGEHRRVFVSFFAGR